MNARVLASLLATLLSALPATAGAQQVLSGDPVDPGTGNAYVVMPGVALVHPGEDEDIGTDDDTINTSITGDIDIVARFGSVTGTSVPAPATGTLTSVVAGGGSTGQGAEAPFTILLTNPAGSSVVTNADMDMRPVAIYAFADIDGDGIVGATNADGSADNEIEKQEALAHVGRQTGTFDAGRFQSTLGMQIGAPASIGGLTVTLVAGGFTGDDPEELFTNGPMLLTRWPFFPPIDPKRLLGGGAAPAPDPEQPTEIQFELDHLWLPAPQHPQLGTPFAVQLNGSEPTTDQMRVVSGPARAVRLYAPLASAASLLARTRSVLRVAPGGDGTGRQVVSVADRVVIPADGAASTRTLRLLPADLLGNVADLDTTMAATVVASGHVALRAPDTDADVGGETIALEDAAGVDVVIDDVGGAGSGSLDVYVGGKLVHTTIVGAGSFDYDGDGVADDGNASGTAPDEPCAVSAAGCDDNCPEIINPSQVDHGGDGVGDCCDGSCIEDPAAAGCDECASPVPPDPGDTGLTRAKVSAKLLSPMKPDVVVLKVSFTVAAGAVLAPDSETVSVSLSQGAEGFAAVLPSAFTSLAKPRPTFVYEDSSGALDGVIKAQIKNTRGNDWKMLLRASAADLAPLLDGTADLELTIGDDTFLAPIVCRASSPRFRCTF